jgi:hypothetical protein
MAEIAAEAGEAEAAAKSLIVPSFRGGSQSRTRNLEIPGSMLRIAPE